MSVKNTVFVDAEVACVTREPTHLSSAAHGQVEDGSGLRQRRRPRKVVVYYFDSDADEEDVAAAVHRGSSSTTGGAAAARQHHSQRENTSMDVEKLDCPDLEELEGYSNDRAAPAAATTTATTCCCCDKKKPISADNPRIGSPTPIGFFAFGMTTLLYNVHNSKICQLNMATMGLVVFFGGLVQFLCGFFELINMNTLGCTISTTYGAFWLATAVLFLVPENTYVTMGDHNFTGGFFLLWFFFAGTLFASSFRSPFMCMALFFLVPLNFLLQSIGYFADSVTVAKVAGYEGIIVGALATYLGMAFTLRDVYGRSLLPILFQKNLKYVEW